MIADDPLDQLTGAPGPVGDFARADLDQRAAAPASEPITASSAARAANRGVRRLKAGDFAARDIPSFSDNTGQPQPIDDEFGGIVTQYDSRNNVGWNSQGAPVQLKYTSPTGPPIVEDAFANVPTTIDRKTGDKYRKRAGLPWQYEGKDEATVAAAKEAEKDKLAANYSKFLGRSLSLDERQLVRDKKDYKDHSETFTNEFGITGDEDDETARKVIEDHFNNDRDGYASERANDTRGWFDGQRTPEAEQYRAGLDARKAEAFARLGKLREGRLKIEQRQTYVDGLRAQQEEIQRQQLAEEAERLRAAGVNIPAASPPISQPQAGVTGNMSPPYGDAADSSSAPATPIDPALEAPPKTPEEAEAKAADTRSQWDYWTGRFGAAIDRYQGTNWLVAGLGAKLLGAKETAKGFIERGRENEAQSEAFQARGAEKIEDIKDPETFAYWLGNTVTDLIPDIVETLTVAAGGALVGSAVPGPGTAVGAVGGIFGKAGVKALVRKATAELVETGIEKTVAREAAETTVRQGIANGTLKNALAGEIKNAGGRAGAFLGAIGSSYKSNAGEIYGDLLSDPDIPEDRAEVAALLFAAPTAGLDAIVPGRIGGKLAGVSEAARKSAKHFITKVATDLGYNSFQEGMTEGGQALIGFAARRWAKDQWAPLTPQEKSEFWNSMAAGAAGGMVFGGVETAADALQGDTPAPGTPPPETPTTPPAGAPIAPAQSSAAVEAEAAAPEGEAPTESIPEAPQGVENPDGTRSPEGEDTRGNLQAERDDLIQRTQRQPISQTDAALLDAERARLRVVELELADTLPATETPSQPPAESSSAPAPAEPAATVSEPISPQVGVTAAPAPVTAGTESVAAPPAGTVTPQGAAKRAEILARLPEAERTELEAIYSTEARFRKPEQISRANALVRQSMAASQPAPGDRPDAEIADEIVTLTASQDQVSLPRELKARKLSPEQRARVEAELDRRGALIGNKVVAPPPTPTISTAADLAAHDAAQSPTNDRPEPTDAQKEAGNYKKGHVRISGLDISIENPQGSKRRGKNRAGTEWEVEMKSHYGYIRGSKGKDGDHIDIFIKPGTSADYEGPVFVVNQLDAQGGFDEHKAVIGVADEAEARQTYEAAYNAGFARPGTIATFPDVASFRQWATGARQRRAPATSIKPTSTESAAPSGEGKAEPEVAAPSSLSTVEPVATGGEASQSTNQPNEQTQTESVPDVSQAESGVRLPEGGPVKPDGITALIAKATKPNAAELKALGHKAILYLAPGKVRVASGIQTNPDTGRIEYDPAKIDEVTKNMTPEQRAEFIRRAVAEEVLHLGFIRYTQESPANRKKALSLLKDAEAVQQAREAYGPEWDQLSDYAKAAEITRMLMQGPTKLTEASYRFLTDFIAWLKQKLTNLDATTQEVIRGVEEKLGRFKPASKTETTPKTPKPDTPKLTAAEQAAKDAAGDLFGAANPETPDGPPTPEPRGIDAAPESSTDSPREDTSPRQNVSGTDAGGDRAAVSAARADSLERAADDIERAAGAVRQVRPGAKDRSAQFEGLVDLAQRDGFYESELIRTPPARAGQEHDVWFEGGQAIKATHWNQFGKTLGGDATPVEYLRRLALTNRVFRDQIEYLGVATDGQRIRLITKQPELKGDPVTDPKDVEKFFAELGFYPVKLDGQPAWYRRSDKTLAFDTHTHNFVKVGNEVVPIDVNVATLSDELAARLVQRTEGEALGAANPIAVGASVTVDGRRATVVKRGQKTAKVRYEDGTEGPVLVDKLTTIPQPASMPEDTRAAQPASGQPSPSGPQAGAFYEPSATWLHGGPVELREGKLLRYGKGSSDMGALFFVKDAPGQRQYAALYDKGAIHTARVNLQPDEVFDLRNPSHRARVEPVVTDDAVGTDFLRSALPAARDGVLDWSTIDGEVLREAGFRGAIVAERPAGTHGNTEAQISLAVFDPTVVETTGRLTETDRSQLQQQAFARPESRAPEDGAPEVLGAANPLAAMQDFADEKAAKVVAAVGSKVGVPALAAAGRALAATGTAEMANDLGAMLSRNFKTFQGAAAELAAMLREFQAGEAWRREGIGDWLKVIDKGGTGNIIGMHIAPAESTPATRELMDKVLHGEADPNVLPPTMKVAAEKIRKLIDHLGQLAVDGGLLSQETYDKNKGKYLGIFYTPRELAANAPKGVKGFVAKFKLKRDRFLPQLSTAWAIVTKNAKGEWTAPINKDTGTTERGPFRFDTPQERDAYLHILIHTKAVEEANRLGAVVTPQIKRDVADRYRKNDPMTEAQYTAAGRIRDGGFTVAKTLATLWHDANLGKLFSDIVNAPDLTQPTETPGYERLPYNPRYGKLAGRWVREDVARNVKEMVEMAPVWLQAYDGMLSWWRRAKVLPNPATWVRNMIFNVGFLSMLAGTNPFNLGNLRYYRDGVKMLKGEHAIKLAELYENGVLGGSYSETELRDMMNDVLVPLPGQAGPHWVWNLVTMRIAALEKGYQFIDDIFKVAAYAKYRDQGMTAKEAAAEVRKWFQYYDNIPNSPAVKALKRTSFPFVSFQLEAARIGMNGLRERPATMAALLAMPALITMYSLMQLGMGDDEAEKVVESMRGMKAGGLPLFSALLPFKDRNGKPIQWDMTNTVPFADLLGQRIDRGDKNPTLWERIAARIISGNPLINITAGIATNEDPFNAQPLRSTGMTGGETLANTARFAGRTLLPPLTPGVGTTWNTLNEPNRRKGSLEERSAATAASRALAGVDLRPAAPSMAKIIADWKEESGAPDKPTFDDSTPRSRARQRLYEALINDDAKGIEREMRVLNDINAPIRTVKDVQEFVGTRDPLRGIRREDRPRFLASLTPIERRTVDNNVKEYQRIVVTAGPRILRFRKTTVSKTPAAATK